jgi:hypothetical protein
VKEMDQHRAACILLLFYFPRAIPNDSYAPSISVAAYSMQNQSDIANSSEGAASGSAQQINLGALASQTARMPVARQQTWISL